MEPNTQRGEISVTWSRSWFLSIPEGQPPEAGYPILVLLHGYSHTAELMAERMGAFGKVEYARLWLNAPFPVERKDPAGERALGGAWYQYSGDQEAFIAALEFAAGYVEDAVTAACQAHALNPARRVLCGYSQGGYVAGFTALRYPEHWRGLIGIATRIKTEAVVLEPAASLQRQVLLIHGKKDRFVEIEPQRKALEALRAAGIPAELEAHPYGHGLKPEIGEHVRAFASKVLTHTPKG